MKTLPIWLLISLGFLLTGCEKYETQFEGPYDDAANPGVLPPSPARLVFAQDGQVHMLNPALTEKKTLISNFGEISLVSVNYAQNLIACKTPGLDVHILDTIGAIKGSVPNTENVTWFDWHKNNLTLYMLDSFTLRFYGPTVNVPVTNLANIFPANAQEKSIPAIAVTPNGWLILAYRWLDTSLEYKSRIRVIPNTSSVASYELNLTGTSKVRYIRLVENGAVALVGFGEPGNYRASLINVSNGSNAAISDAELGAIHPDAADAAFWKNGKIFSHNDNETGVLVGSSPVTSMDW